MVGGVGGGLSALPFGEETDERELTDLVRTTD